MNKPIVIVVGTRPGAIKSIPVYLALREKGIPTIFIATFQHNDILQQVFDLFNVVPDIRLDVMQKNQDLFYLTSTIMERIKKVYLDTDPSLVLVHGDTTTAFASALAAFYLKIPLGHLEAGLRTGNIYAPFPEEINRTCISRMATYHFAPTSLSVANLYSEGIDRKKIFCVGNVVVDALLQIKNKIESNAIAVSNHLEQQVISAQRHGKKIILLTAHRRESFDGGLHNIFKSVKAFVKKHDDTLIIFPVHPNPHVLAAVQKTGFGSPNIYCCSPVDYKDLVYLMLHAHWVMTDSGGIQEEAMSLGKKVLVLRNVTERMEGVWEGLGILVGTDQNDILTGMKKLYEEKTEKIFTRTIYGDGKSSQRIATILKEELQLIDNDNNNELCKEQNKLIKDEVILHTITGEK